jgi:addiction module HigA family antidote
MIVSFKDEGTRDIYRERDTRKARKACPGILWPAVREMLDALDFAQQPEDLRDPPGNRLKRLKGDRAEGFSVRINDQYRVCFRWTDDGPADVEIVDYHQETGKEHEMESIKLAARLPENRPPTHPGQILLHLYLEPAGLTQAELAKRIGVSYVRVNELVNGRRGITPDTALRLARLFQMSAEFWLNGQLAWDMWHALRSPAMAEIEKIEPLVHPEGAGDEDEVAPLAAG